MRLTQAFALIILPLFLASAHVRAGCFGDFFEHEMEKARSAQGAHGLDANARIERARNEIDRLNQEMNALDSKAVSSGGKASQDFEALRSKLTEEQRQLTEELNAKARKVGGFEVVPMNENYVGENVFAGKLSDGREIPKPHYFDEAERARTKLVMKDGRIYTSDGRLYDTRGDVGIYVMDRDGSFYSVRENDYRSATGMKVNHSSFLAGGPVAAAGEMVVENGVLKVLNRSSGHYTPGFHILDQAEEGMRQLGVSGFEIDQSGRF